MEMQATQLHTQSGFADKPSLSGLDSIPRYKVHTSTVSEGVQDVAYHQPSCGRRARQCANDPVLRTARTVPSPTAQFIRLSTIRGGAVERLRFIKHAQDLGFSLKEIQDLLRLRVRHGVACDAVERKTRAKIQLVQQKIAGLRRVERTLEQLAAACSARRPTEECPILDALEDHGDVSK